MKFYRPITPAMRRAHHEAKDEALHPQPDESTLRLSGAARRRLNWERIKLLQLQRFLDTHEETKPIEHVQRGRAR